jgi:hypothetical protein
VRNGKATSFWWDWWQGSGALCTRFIALFAISADQEASVESTRRGDEWHLVFRREMGLGERIGWGNLSREVTVPPTSELQDDISWAIEPSRILSVRSMYPKLCQGIPNKHFSDLWRIAIPMKVHIFLW